MIPSPSDLIYFIEVANLLNLSRAAECLGISQPSLTLAMRRIENAVGTPILTRHKKGVTLTRAGIQLLAHSKQLLQKWESIKAETLASIVEIQGNFSIGCHVSLALHTLPNFLTTLLVDNPKLEIKLQHGPSRKITEQVINLKIDIGIVANPTRHPDLVIKHLFYDKVKLWRSSQLNKNQDLTSGETVILCDPDLIQTQAILKALKKQHINYKRIIYSDSLEVLAELTKKGCGIGIIPSNIATPRGLISIAKTPTYQDEICLLYRGENRNVKSIQVITDAIKHSIKENK